jgi:hypothetical protein
MVMYLTDIFPASPQDGPYVISDQALALRIEMAYGVYLSANQNVRAETHCVHPSPGETFESYAAKQEAFNREQVKSQAAYPALTRIVRVDWKYDPAKDVGISHTGNASSSQSSDSNKPFVDGAPMKMFMYCYTIMSGGVNTYFSDVFSLEIPATDQGHYLLPDQGEVSRIKNAFDGFLTRQGYKHNPNTVECDSRFAPHSSKFCGMQGFCGDEQDMSAQKHKRAYGGNPCANCGKVVETHWKYDQAATAAAQTSQGTSDSPAQVATDHPAPNPVPEKTKTSQSAPGTNKTVVGVCWADATRPQVYFTAPFDGTDRDYSAWEAAFKRFLATNYSYHGFVRCNTQNSYEEASNFLQMEKNTYLRDPSRSIVGTGWKYK